MGGRPAELTAVASGLTAGALARVEASIFIPPVVLTGRRRNSRPAPSRWPGRAGNRGRCLGRRDAARRSARSSAAVCRATTSTRLLTRARASSNTSALSRSR